MSSPPLLANVTGDGGNESLRCHSKPSAGSLEPSLLLIILILLMTALISISLFLLLRHFNRQCLRRLSPSSSTSASASAEPRRYSGSRISPETASFSLTNSLPLFTFSSVARRSNSALAASSVISGDCAICLSNFEPLDQLRLLPMCCHAFHVGCVDKWLVFNKTCPLCRSTIEPSYFDLAKAFEASSSASAAASGGNESFRIEIGSISRRQAGHGAGDQRSSYSLGSFEYVLGEELEVSASSAHLENVSNEEDDEGVPSAQEQSLAAELGSSGSRNWARAYMERLSRSVSARTLSFHGSGRFLGGSNRVSGSIDLDLEANRVGQEIREMFRWFSGE